MKKLLAALHRTQNGLQLIHSPQILVTTGQPQLFPSLLLSVNGINYADGWSRLHTTIEEKNREWIDPALVRLEG